MKTNYTIKNFRVFDRKGVTVEIAPLTFLVGCNSSGKSSIVKSLSLLRTMFDRKFGRNRPVMGTTIDFSVKPNDTLGSFRNVVRSSSKDKVISLEYMVHSVLINDDVAISLTLGEGNLGNAIITGVKVSRMDGTVLVDGRVDSHNYSGSMLSLKDAFKPYLVALRFRSIVRMITPLPEELITSEEEHEINEKILSLYQEACRYCDPKYIYEVPRDAMLEWKNASQAIDRFVETGIMTYFSIFDEMGSMTDADEIRRFLESKIPCGDLADSLKKAIGMICDDYAKVGCSDFLSYYCSLEDESLFSSFNLNLLCEVLQKDEWPSLLSTFSLGSMNLIYSIAEGSVMSVNYELVNDTLALLSENDSYTDVYYDDKEFGDPRFSRTIHPLYSDAFKDYVNRFFLEIFNEDVTEGLDYISSSRIQVRRLYPMEDRTEFSDAVKRYFETRTKYMTLKPPIILTVENEDGRGTHTVEASGFLPGSFMNKWLKVFRIGDHMLLEMDKNGLGLLLKVYHSEYDKKGVLLADMGYGITQLFSILLQIEEMIMSSLYNKFNGMVTTASLGKFGGDVVLSHYADAPFAPRTVAIEEPEIHLHPKYQSLLAEMFYEAYREYNIQFIVETHSEYLLRKVQTLIGTKKLTPEEVSLTYVEDDEAVKDGAPKVRRIPVKEDGRLAASFSPGFYDEADNLSMELFTNMGK